MTLFVYSVQSSDDYLKDVPGLSPVKRTEQVNAILKMFNRAKEFSDDKVHLAVQTYELVGRRGTDLGTGV